MPGFPVVHSNVGSRMEPYRTHEGRDGRYSDTSRQAAPAPRLATEHIDDPRICLDWVHGKCSRPNCRFLHSSGDVPAPQVPAKSVVIDDPNVCLDWVYGKCSRANCRFLHSASGVSVGASRAEDHGQKLSSYAPPPAAPVLVDDSKICLDWIHGKCSRQNCRFLHAAVPTPTGILPNLSPKALSPLAPVAGEASNICLDWLHGKCVRQNCRFLHTQTSAVVPPVIAQLAPQVPSSSSSLLEVCHDWLNARCNRDQCRFLHSQLPLNMLDFCKDHLAGKCNRESCRFYHGTQEQWTAQQILKAASVQTLAFAAAPQRVAPPARSIPAEEFIPTNICRDFVRGKCDRPDCRFDHSDPSEGRIPSHVCRDFARGSCTRADCRFDHDESYKTSKSTLSSHRYKPY